MDDLFADPARIRPDCVQSRVLARRAFTVEALALRGDNLGHPAHQFWSDRLRLPDAVKRIEARLQGYRQLTDAYLLALAHRRKGVLATFDRGLGALAGDEFGSSLEIVRTR